MKYRVIDGPWRFAPGCVLGLTAGQAAPRRHNLCERAGGRFEVVSTVEFKTDEVVDVLRAEIGKAALRHLVAVDAPVAPVADAAGGSKTPAAPPKR